MKSKSKSEEWREILRQRLIAESNAYFEVRLQQRIAEAIREARKQTEIERREALKEFGIDVEDDDIRPLSTTGRSSPETSQDSIMGRNGSPLNRREMIREVLPDFHGEAFSQSDVRKMILERWPDADAPSLASGIANLLKEMAEEGRLERLGGNPLQYREKPQNQEGTLDMGP